MKEPITKVIFRKFRNGDVIALFPGIAGDFDPMNCNSYMHVGQHGTATTRLVSSTKPAKPSEYRELAQELRRIGYRLKIVKRFTRSDYNARKEQVKL